MMEEETWLLQVVLCPHISSHMYTYLSHKCVHTHTPHTVGVEEIYCMFRKIQLKSLLHYT